MSCIYVADHDLFSRSTSRRFLCGIATLLNEPVCVTPRVVTEVINSVSYLETQEVIRIMEDQGIRDRQFEARVITRVESAVREWVDESILSDEGPVRCIGGDPESHVDAIRWASRIPKCLFRNLNRSELNNDLVIIAESIAAAADLVLSNNMVTINQFQLNEWVLNNGIRNQPLIQSTDLGMPRLLGDRFDDHCHRSAICMTLPYEPQESHEEPNNVMVFAGRLRQTFALCANTIEIEEARSPRRNERWAESRRDIGLVKWKDARDVETIRRDKVREAAREEGLEI